MKNAILEILKNDSRVTNAEIARRLSIPEPEVQRTIEELEQNKTILGYKAVVDAEKIDENLGIGIIEVKISPQRSKGYDSIASQIYRFPEVKLCYLISGDYDLLIFVEGHSLKEVSLFVTEKLATIEHVRSTTTHFILKKFKEFGVMM